jgi:hypothetical protein
MVEKMSRVNGAENSEARWNWFYKISGGAALLLALLFLVAILVLVITVLQPGMINDWLSFLQNNWLMILFKINAGVGEVQFNQLYGVNPVDLVLMTLVIVMYAGLYVVLKRTSRIWSMIAAILPILGTIIFIATKLAGRSSVMAAGIVISFVMLPSNVFRKAIGFVGILACLLLLVGDFGTTANSTSTIVAILVGAGYVLLIIWLFSISRRFSQLG